MLKTKIFTWKIFSAKKKFYDLTSKNYTKFSLYLFFSNLQFFSISYQILGIAKTPGLVDTLKTVRCRGSFNKIIFSLGYIPESYSLKNMHARFY